MPFLRACIIVCCVASLIATSGCEQIKQMAEKAGPEEAKQAATESPEPAAPGALPGFLGGDPNPDEPKTEEQLLALFQQTLSFLRTDSVLEDFCKLEIAKQLETLDLTSSPVTEVGISALKALPNLKTLNLSGTRMTPPALQAASELPQLEVLYLDRTGIDTSGVELISQMPALKVLGLTGNALTDPALDTLKAMETLESLYVDGNVNLYGHDLGVAVKAGAYPRLKEFTANGTNIGHYGLFFFGNLKDLEVLKAAQSTVTDEAMKSIGRCPNLRVLELYGNPLTDAGVQELAKATKLEELNLSNCRGVSDRCFNTLKNLKSLKQLNLSNTACTESAVRKLAKDFLRDADIVYNGERY